MKAIGIRIFDGKNVLSAELPDILNEISVGQSMQWSILFIDSIADWKREIPPPIPEDDVNESVNGLILTWEELNEIGSKFYQIIDLLLIGSKDKKFLRRYSTDQEMYESCDIVIEVIDGGFWQIFSKDESVIVKLANKYKKIELIDSASG